MMFLLVIVFSFCYTSQTAILYIELLSASPRYCLLDLNNYITSA